MTATKKTVKDFGFNGKTLGFRLNQMLNIMTTIEKKQLKRWCIEQIKTGSSSVSVNKVTELYNNLLSLSDEDRELYVQFYKPYVTSHECVLELIAFFKAE